MATAKTGDRVKFNFTGTLKDGTIFDTTYDDVDCTTDACETEDCRCDTDGCGCESGPVELVIGEEAFFPQVEEALVGMAPGEKKSVTVSAADAFGPYEDEKVFQVGRDELPEDLDPQVGLELVVTGDDDEGFEVTITEVGDENVTFDANHPLAGQDLTFELELAEIV